MSCRVDHHDENRRRRNRDTAVQRTVPERICIIAAATGLFLMGWQTAGVRITFLLLTVLSEFGGG